MANIKYLNAKILEEKLKHGWTTSQFAEYFECTEKEFIYALNKNLSSHAARGMISRLKRNDKRSKKSDSSEKTVVIENTTSFKNEVDERTAIIVPSEIEDVVEKVPEEDSLESLKHQKSELQSLLNDLELQHKGLTSDRLQIRTLISSYRDRLVVLKTEIHQCQTDINSLIEELNSKMASMQILNSQISEARKSLEQINMNIEKLQKISIFVYSSSNIDVEISSNPLDIKAVDWSNFFDIIVKDDDAGSLTINQIKGLAKAIALIEFLDSQKLKYEITFEDENSEKFFTKYKGG